MVDDELARMLAMRKKLDPDAPDIIAFPDPAAITKQLSSIVDIQRFLIEWRDDRFLKLGQFCLDWIEETLDRIIEILESEEITTDDETFRGATHYRADCLLEVLRKDTDYYEFFFQLAQRTSSNWCSEQDEKENHH